MNTKITLKKVMKEMQKDQDYIAKDLQEVRDYDRSMKELMKSHDK